MLQKSIDLCKSYGFKHLTVFQAWRKINSNNTPYMSKTNVANLTQPNHEFLIISYQGNYKCLLQHTVPIVSQELSTLALPHSQKPEQVYTIISQVFKVDTLPCIELFARCNSHPFFDLYGDSIPSYFATSQKTISDNTHFSMHVGQILSCSSDQTSTNFLQPFLKQYDNDAQSKLQTLLKHTPFKDSQLQECISFLYNFLHIFAWSSHEVGKMVNIKHKIQLIPNAIPKAFPPYKHSTQHRSFIESEIQELLKLGYIVRGVSPWAAPVIVVPKQGGLRMVIDFRYLNSQTVKQHWPLPTFDDFLQYLNNAKYVSKLDLRSGFFNQLYDSASDEELVSFVCHLGQFKCKRLWFGLCNAPSSFQRGIMDALGDVLFKSCLVYIDDILIFSSSFKQHLLDLQIVFSRLAKANVKLHPTKCQLFCTSCDFLGHTIDNGTIKPHIKRFNLLQNMSPPTTRTQVKCFLGLISYYRRFIPNFSSIAQPLNMLLQKEQQFIWQTSQQTAFDQLRKLLLDLPTLYLPSPTRQFSVTTDFSCKGLGAVLSQLDKDGLEYPIAFISRTLNKFERKYGSYEGEVLAVMFALSKLRHFLLGQHFILNTDNKALQQVLHHRSPSPKIHRWLLQLSDYTFTVVHRKGKDNCNADALSRLAPLEQQVVSSVRQKHVFFKLRPRIFYYNSKLISRIHKRYITFLKSSFIDPPKLRSILVKPQQVSLHVSNTVLPYTPIDIKDLICPGCNHTDNASQMYICEQCGNGFHVPQCFPHQPPFIPNDFYYCSTCLHDTFSSKDVCHDFSLLNYIKTHIMPKDISEAAKTHFLESKNFLQYQDNAFQIKLNNTWRFLPTPFARKQILFQNHDNVGHPGIKKTIGLIQLKYHWPSIRTDVIQHISKCTLCLAKRSNFRDNDTLLPLPKGTQPFSFWSIDLITGLPKSLEGFQHIMVCVCSFSKWVELLPLKTRSSLECAHAFYRDVICRYGKPIAIRSDNGTEFKQSFQQLLHYIGIPQSRTNTNRPRSNGQAERFVQTTISLLRNVIHSNAFDLGDWPECLPTVAYTLRMSPSVLNQSPFQVIHGITPTPISPLDHDELNINFFEPSQTQIDAYTKTLQQVQTQSFQMTTDFLKSYDSKQKQKFENKISKKPYEFKVNDMVFKNVGPRTTKLQLQSEGPYMIKQFINENTVSIIDISNNNMLQASIYNLLPIPSIKTRDMSLDIPDYTYYKRNTTTRKGHIGQPKNNL